MVVRPMARSGGPVDDRPRWKFGLDYARWNPYRLRQGGILTALGKAEYLECKTRWYVVLV